MLGIPEVECGGVFIGENAHKSRDTALYLQGKWSSAQAEVCWRLPAEETLVLGHSGRSS